MKTKHGMYKTPEYQAWVNMKQRCQNPTHPLREWYYDKGIRVCEAWQTFEGFIADMGPRPGKGFYLDRLDNDKWYEPGNVRWATKRQSMLNRSFITSAYPRGVRQYKNGRYQARIKIGGVEHHIGYYETVEDAVAARKQWEIEHDR